VSAILGSEVENLVHRDCVLSELIVKENAIVQYCGLLESGVFQRTLQPSFEDELDSDYSGSACFVLLSAFIIMMTCAYVLQCAAD